MSARGHIEPALPRPCAVCPWRLSNQGTPHPHGFYDRANLKRLWDGLRTGEAPGMTCHPTDPDMAEFEGYEETAEREVTHECMGSWIMVMREVAHFQSLCKDVEDEEAAGASFKPGEAYRRYRAAAGRKGMNLEGLASWAFRLAVVMPGQNAIRVNNQQLEDPEIGAPVAPPFEPGLAAKAMR